MSQHFDLIAIGTGMAGVAAANTCAGQDLRHDQALYTSNSGESGPAAIR